MSNQLKDTKSSIFLNLDTDEEKSEENQVTLTKPKRKYSKKIKMNDKNIYFDNNLNIYYQNSFVGSFILHPQYKNFDQKIIENKKTKLEYIEKPTEEIINPIITNQNMLINKLIEDPFHSFQNANNKPQVELINTNKKKISNVIYNKEYHINDFTFNTKPIINRTPEFYKEQIKSY